MGTVKTEETQRNNKTKWTEGYKKDKKKKKDKTSHQEYKVKLKRGKTDKITGVEDKINWVHWKLMTEKRATVLKKKKQQQRNGELHGLRHKIVYRSSKLEWLSE